MKPEDVARLELLNSEPTFTGMEIDPELQLMAAKRVALQDIGNPEKLLFLDMLGIVKPQLGNEVKSVTEVKVKQSRLRTNEKRQREATAKKLSREDQNLADRGIHPSEYGEVS